MKLGIIGGGAYGTALGLAFSRNFKSTHLFAIEQNVIDDINKRHKNDTYLQGFILPNSVVATSKIEDICSCDIVLLTTPTQFIRSTVAQLKGKITSSSVLLICAKGVEITSGKLLSSVCVEELGDFPNIGVLSGPTFAKEIALGCPSALLIAMRDLKKAKEIAETLSTKTVKLYYGDDIIGSQVGGAVKNVLAVASGVIKGAGLGHNALALFLTMGLRELKVLSRHFGGHDTTVMGLSGFGDLILTATSPSSRNFSLGLEIGKKGYYENTLKGETKGVTEGFYTAKVLYEIIKQHQLHMPLCEEIYYILYENKPLKQSIVDLMGKPIREE